MGNTLRPPIRSTPVAPSIVTLVIRLPPGRALPVAPAGGGRRRPPATRRAIPLLAAGRQLDGGLLPGLADRVEPHRPDLDQRRLREVRAVGRLRRGLRDHLELLGDGRRLLERGR